MAFPEKGLQAFPGAGGAHADDSGLDKDELKALEFNELERVSEIGMNGLEATAISAGATVNLATSDAPTVPISGSGGPITSFGTIRAGWTRRLRFTGTPTIQHGGSAIVCPLDADIVVEAGDTCMVTSGGAGVWYIWNYQRKSGLALIGGVVVQHKFNSTGAYASISVPLVTNFLVAVPLAQTVQVFGTQAITPKFTDSKIIVEAFTVGTFAGNSREMVPCLFKDAEGTARAANYWKNPVTGLANTRVGLVRYVLDPSGSLVAQTWDFRMGCDVAASAFQRSGIGGSQMFGGGAISWLDVKEVRP